MEKQKTCYLFFDFDGTITVDQSTTLPDGSVKKCRILPESHLASLKAVHDAGHKMFLCTGRSRGSMLNVGREWAPALELPWDGMLFGASDMWYNGERISVTYIPRDECLFWVDYCKRTRRIFCYNGTESVIRYDFSKPMSSERIGESDSDIEKQLSDNPLTNFSTVPSAVDYDREKTELTVVHLKTYSDVFPACCNKGAAILRYCELLNIPLEQTVCFGDSENDIDMFKACNTSVAMKKAPESLKSVATYSALTELGVSEAISKLFGIQ